MRRLLLKSIRFHAGILALPAAVFLAIGFVLPLSRFLALAFTGAGGPFGTFKALATSEVYLRVFLNTVVVASFVTAITVTLAWPVAYLLSRLRGYRFALVLYGVLFPLWISVLVRSFSWMLLLERNGPINRTLISIGLISEPLALLFNRTGELIGMVHVMLPYAILPLYAAMSRIDRRLLLASDGLGAGLFDTFRHIYLPLSLPGLYGAATFVFLPSLGFFITPAMLGGANAVTLSMLISTFVSERLEWDLAAAASMVLLAVTLVILGICSRLVPLGQEIGNR
jgi:putative spermidine/putrescine transport system permease protein